MTAPAPEAPEGFVRVTHDSLKDAEKNPASAVVSDDPAVLAHWASLGWTPVKAPKSTTTGSGAAGTGA